LNNNKYYCDFGYKNFKKPELVKEALGKLGNLTPELLYHLYSRVKQTKSYSFFLHNMIFLW